MRAGEGGTELIEFKQCLLKSNERWPKLELHAHNNSLRVR